MFNPISTFDNYTILECVYKCVIEKQVPHSVDQFATAMRQYILLLHIPLLMECGYKIIKVVRELQ